MATALKANRRELRLSGIRGRNVTVDIAFDGHRIWSTRLPPARKRGGVRRVPWPPALLPYLKGRTTLEVTNSATGVELGRVDVRFGGDGRASVTDAQGRWLAMNKWDRLGPSFDGDPTGVQQRLLDASVLVAKHMADWGYPVYIVGGTLLGALRTGELLPHDDDIDFAFYCHETNPMDIIIASFKLQRQLEAEGYTVVRHSHTHLEIAFLTPDGHTDYYIDIFTGYHGEDGQYNQPFAIRGDLPLEKVLPAQNFSVGGVELPGPAQPDAWCELAYGPDWLVPDPSFRWETPRAVTRDFNNYFGAFNRQRVYWEKTWMKADSPAESLTEAEESELASFLDLLPASTYVIDLGCGDGRFAERIAAAGHEVTAIDYSFEALRVAGTREVTSADYQFLNLNDRHQVLEFTLDLIDRRKRPYLFARNLLHNMQRLGRSEFLGALPGLLEPDTFCFASFDTNPIDRIPSNPETWHLTPRILRREAWRSKLGITLHSKRERDTAYGIRNNLTVLIGR